jgi:phage-related protein
VQSGHDPSDWKSMVAVGAGVREIRIHVDGAYRVLYLATRPEAVFVLHAFSKKSQRAQKLDTDVARARFKDVLRERG